MKANAQATEAEMDTWDYIMLKRKQKKKIKRMKRQPQNRRKYLQTTYLTRG